MASEVLFEISKDEIERARLLSELKYELDMQSLRVTAEREGRKEGLEEGRKEERIAIAKNALANGLTIETIHKLTGLDIDNIRKLDK